MVPGLDWLADVLVVDAAGAAAYEQAVIAQGVPSRALMERAGAAAATEIMRRYPDLLRERGAAVHVGPGNNGGDGWVVLRALAAAGVRVAVAEAVEPKTEDAQFERSAAGLDLIHAVPSGEETEEERHRRTPFEETPEGATAAVASAGVHVDALLGTGASGPPRGRLVDAVERVNYLRERGAVVVALDVPSGIDATTGWQGQLAVRADLTLTFGTLKRGLLLAREHAGEIAVLDIGLTPAALLRSPDALRTPTLVTARRVARLVPRIAADAHKGSRGRLAIVGGGRGMVGAAVIAARAAYRSGIGLVKLCVAPENVSLAQQLVPEAIAEPWPDSADAAGALVEWTHALVLGPGLGRGVETRELVERVLDAGRVPAVLDADALNVFEGEPEALASRLKHAQSIVTPHPTEFARLAGLDTREVLARRFELGADLARRIGATVLLKGVPTVIHHPTGGNPPAVSATGTPALAVGGSGDLLAGICGTLLAQMHDGYESAACAAWVHGRAGELASADGRIRGVTLDDVLARLGDAWPQDPGPARYPVLAELPGPGGGRR